jgi:hypothetical protein
MSSCFCVVCVSSVFSARVFAFRLCFISCLIVPLSPTTFEVTLHVQVAVVQKGFTLFCDVSLDVDAPRKKKRDGVSRCNVCVREVI